MLAEHEVFENNKTVDPLIWGTYYIEIIEIHEWYEANLHFLKIRIWNLEIVKILK